MEHSHHAISDPECWLSVLGPPGSPGLAQTTQWLCLTLRSQASDALGGAGITTLILQVRKLSLAEVTF